MKKLVLALTFSLLLSGCGDLQKQQRDIQDLKDKISALQSSNDMLMAMLANNTYPRILNFTPQDSMNGFKTIHLNIGNFFVSLLNIEKFPGGYKISFAIKNPYSTGFSDLKAIVSCEGGDKTMSNSSTIPMIYSGIWTPFVVIISPATEKEITQIYLTFSDELTKI
jgi:hypothetical protein